MYGNNRQLGRRRGATPSPRTPPARTSRFNNARFNDAYDDDSSFSPNTPNIANAYRNSNTNTYNNRNSRRNNNAKNGNNRRNNGNNLLNALANPAKKNNARNNKKNNDNSAVFDRLGPLSSSGSSSPLNRLNFSYASNNNRNNAGNNGRPPVVSFAKNAPGRVLNNNFAAKPALPLPQMACGSSLKAGGDGGIRAQAFRQCFVKHLQTAVAPMMTTSNAAMGNAAKMDALCTQAGLSPHQTIVYEIAKVMANVDPERLGGHRGLLTWHAAGSGKCFARDTPVLMYDGTIKMVQDVRVGDRVMGDDGTPRNVLDLGRGYEDMYEIRPTKKGDPFTCNASHILVLKYIHHKTVVQNRRGSFTARFADDDAIRSRTFASRELAEDFLKTVDDSPLVQIEVRDYLELPGSQKHVLKQFRTGVDFADPVEPLFDPYVLGVWLGDGSSRAAEFTIVEQPLVDAVRAALEPYDMQLLRKTPIEGKAAQYYASSVTEFGKNNPFLNALRSYKMLENKHIPHEIKTGSRETRLKVLAGLLDTDGFLSNNCYEIMQKRKALAEDLAFVARSLGFHVYVRPVVKHCTYNGQRREGTYHRVSICGAGLETIPVSLDRKRASPRKQIKNALHFGFDVVPRGVDRYYGFCVDGNHRYLLGDFTVTHNTVTSLGVILAFWPTEKKIVLVSSKVNTAQAIESYKREVPKFFPEEFKAIAAEYRKRKRADHLSDKEAFDDALAERVVGLTFVEARNRIAAHQGEFKTIKDMRLYAGAGSVLIIDEAQGLAMKTRSDPNGDGIKLGCALRGMSREKLSKIHVFAMTATPGNSVREWLRLLSVVRRCDQAPFTSEDSGGTNSKGRPLCEPRKSPGGAVDWAALIEKELARGSVSFYDKLGKVLFGLYSHADIRTDRSRHACVSQREMKMQLDRYYFLLMLRANATDRRAVKSASDKAQHQYDPRYPDAFMKKMRLLGHSLPKTLWSTLPKHVQEELFRRRRILKVDSRSEGRYVSNKLVAMATSIAKLPGKEYVYTVSGNEFILGAALARWFGMTDVTKKSETFDGAYLNKNTKQVVGIPKGNNFVVLNDATRKDHKERITQIFNSEANSDGSYIKVVVATGQLYEGLDLAGLRYVHLDPMPSPLHEVQAMGRGVRNCSHRFLPVADRKVTIVRWFAAAPDGGWSAFESLLSTMRGMRGRIGPTEIKEEYDRLNSGNPGGRPRGYDELVFDRSRDDPSVKMLWNFELVAKSLAVDCEVLSRYTPGVSCGKAPKLLQSSDVPLPGAPC